MGRWLAVWGTSDRAPAPPRTGTPVSFPPAEDQAWELVPGRRGRAHCSPAPARVRSRQVQASFLPCSWPPGCRQPSARCLGTWVWAWPHPPSCGRDPAQAPSPQPPPPCGENEWVTRNRRPSLRA